MKTKLLSLLSIISFNFIISQGTNVTGINYHYQQVISSGFLSASTSVSDHDNDGIDDATDIDDDNDGIPDIIECNGIDPLTDNDNDGVPVYLDDNDNDNSVGDADNMVEPSFDLDSDGIPNHFDLDSDNDGLFDVCESGQVNGTDTNMDGILEGNVGSNGLVDDLETTPDSGTINYTLQNTDSDTYYNFLDVDDDNDNILTINEYPNSNGNGCDDNAMDTDGNGIPNYLDEDDDGDGINTIFEDVELPNNYPQDGNPMNDDTDGDGIPNYLDNDDDGDGILTINEHADDNGNHEPDDALDSNGNGIPDYLDPDTGSLSDYNKEIVKIFPNPAYNFINIKFDKFTTSTIVISDVSGKELLHFVLKNKHQKIDISSLKSGTYLLKVQNDKTGVKVFTFIKEVNLTQF